MICVVMFVWLVLIYADRFLRGIFLWWRIKMKFLLSSIKKFAHFYIFAHFFQSYKIKRSISRLTSLTNNLFIENCSVIKFYKMSELVTFKNKYKITLRNKFSYVVTDTCVLITDTCVLKMKNERYFLFLFFS